MAFPSTQSFPCFPTKFTEPLRSVPTSCGPAHRSHLTSQNAMLDLSRGLSHLLSLLLRSLFYSSSSFCGSQSSGHLLDVIVWPWVQTCAHCLSTWSVHQILSIMKTEEYIEDSQDLNRSNNYIEKEDLMNYRNINKLREESL